MKITETHKYDDIIHLSRPYSGRRPRMSHSDRAAQFSPFAALTGFEDAIAETGRLTDSRIELDEGEKELLDQQVQSVLEVIHTCPRTKILWFQYDERKAGGRYITTIGRIKKIDFYNQKLILTDGQVIPLGEVSSLIMTE